MKRFMLTVIALLLAAAAAGCRSDDSAPAKQTATATTTASTATVPMHTASDASTDPTTATTEPTQPNAEQLNHVHTYTDKVTAPTCTKDGYTTHTCSCGNSYVDTKVPSTGHSYGEWVTTKEPTTTSTGLAERVCATCKNKETKTLGKVAENHVHNYSSKITKAATCSAEGVRTFTCSCGDKYTESIAKTAHQYVDTVKKPTCLNEGYTTHKCSCGDTYTDSKTKALGHEYTNKVTAPTCTAVGYTTHTCTRCGTNYSDTEKVALGHDYKDTVVAPKCTVGGYTKHACSRCTSAYIDTKTEATGHAYKETSDTATCTSDGIKTETCGNCGNKKTSASKATGHVKTTVEDKASTCIEAGYTKETCDACGAVLSNVKKPLTDCEYKTMRLSDAAAICSEKWHEYGEYLGYTDWKVDACKNCGWLEKDTIRFAYSDYEAAVIMLGYVNGLRESVYGTDEYNLTLDSNLIAIANRRAKEISVDGNFDHSGATCPENIIGGGGSNMSLYEQFVRWKNSSGHYKNMIEKDFTTFGYGFYASAPNAEIFATQCFGEK